MPAGFITLVDAALECYLRRFSLYLGLSIAAFAVNSVALRAFPKSFAALLIFDALATLPLVGIVTLGVAADIGGKPFASLTAFGETLRRGWAIVMAGMLLDILGSAGLGWIAASDSAAQAMFFILPVLVVYGTMLFAPVICMLDEGPWWSLLPRSIFASIHLSWNGNLGRVTALAAFQVPALLLADLVQTYVQHVRGMLVASLAVAAIFALVTGIYQALATVFFLDALARVKAVE